MGHEHIGACGISCDACGLVEKGICTYCGPGDTEAARAKLESQRNRFGGLACPVLICAVMNQIAFCMRDCPDFPCEHYESTLTGDPYPFSSMYLRQHRMLRNPKTDPDQAEPDDMDLPDE